MHRPKYLPRRNKEREPSFLEDLVSLLVIFVLVGLGSLMLYALFDPANMGLNP